MGRGRPRPRGSCAVRVVRGTEFREWERDKAKTAALRWILATRLASRELRPGDIVIEISGGGPEQPVGRTLLIDEEALRQEPPLPLICCNFCRLLRIHPALDPAFVHLALREKYLRGDVWHFQNQTTNLRNLQLDEYLEGTFLRVPPLAEQRRIVAAAEELLARAAATRDSLLAARRVLRKLRQAVLAAGSGRAADRGLAPRAERRGAARRDPRRRLRGAEKVFRQRAAAGRHGRRAAAQGAVQSRSRRLAGAGAPRPARAPGGLDAGSSPGPDRDPAVRHLASARTKT